jgi:hypothetical protein
MVKDFSHNPIARGVIELAHRINEAIGKTHGERYMFDLRPRHDGGTFKTKNLKGEPMEVRINAIVPSEEIFTISQELVRQADEPFAAREVFEEDTSFHPGSREVGFDVLSETGEASLVAVTEEDPAVMQANVRIDRNFQPVCKIAQAVSITRDEIQYMDLRQDRGLSPLVDLMTEKLSTAKKNIDRVHDRLIWKGAEIKGVAGGRILGVGDFLSTDPALNSGSAPSKGRIENVAAGAGGTKWDDKTSDEIIKDLAKGFAYINRLNTYKATHFVLPPSILTGRLAFRRTSDVDSTPLIEWIQRAARLALGSELKIVASNAMEKGTIDGTTRPVNLFAETAFMLLDSKKQYQAIATIEPLVMLPPETNKFGTITQVLQCKTSGIMVKHPSTMYAGVGIA